MVLCAGDHQAEVASQRSKRLRRGVDGKKGFGEGRQGGEQGSQPSYVVEVAVADEDVAHGFGEMPAASRRASRTVPLEASRSIVSSPASGTARLV